MSSQAGKRLGLLVCRPEAISRLSDPLTARGWVIAHSAVLADEQAQSIAGAGLFETASVLVVDLDGADNSQLQHLNELVSVEERPILFNDSSHDADWSQHLHQKLVGLLGAVEQSDVVAEDHVVTASISDGGLINEPVTTDGQASAAAKVSEHVWLLSGSLGGPESLRDFFRALSPGLPVSFIVMQRIAREHIDVLENHVKQFTDYAVTVLKSPMVLTEGSIILVTDGSCFSIGSDNSIALDSASPCEQALNEMMSVLAKRYGRNAGAIIFSAIGEDGVDGCEQILASGGRVWLQEGVAGYFAKLQPPQDDDSHRFEVATAAHLAQRLSGLYQQKSTNGDMP